MANTVTVLVLALLLSGCSAGVVQEDGMEARTALEGRDEFVTINDGEVLAMINAFAISAGLFILFIVLLNLFQEDVAPVVIPVIREIDPTTTTAAPTTTAGSYAATTAASSSYDSYGGRVGSSSYAVIHSIERAANKWS
ncbi:unnamed protein product [Meganyctiphanes norvegica]|uniref:Uncharacterized protein n=1 Tax=Meganyctiphanes norvegica TaxID=48144 RepID=A0AAV2RHP7_MEGNR